jgi:RsiW-degrading membrane proteinase PrsW (M82 family)
LLSLATTTYVRSEKTTTMLKIATVILAPALFWLLYHRWKDRRQPEPIPAVLLAYAAGVGSGWVGLAAYDLTRRLGLTADPATLASSDVVGLLGYTLLIVGPLEELVKFLPFVVICSRLPAFDEEIDGVVYASAVALGFASFENFQYMRFLEGADLAARAVASPLTHAMFASVWGFAYGRARMRGGSIVRACVLGVALAALLHGLYDFLALSVSVWLRPAAALLILTIWIWRMRLFRSVQVS